MFKCKLCGEELHESHVSSADKNMCRPCYSDMVNYRRWTTRTDYTPTPSQESTIHRLEQMFRHNMQHGGYVPKCFTKDRKDVECQTCGKVFKTSTGITLCWECQIREGEYRKLLADKERGAKTYGGLEGIAKRVWKEQQKSMKDTVAVQKEALHKLDAYYSEKHSQGKRVPLAWIERWG